jgi:hypothetical protein
MWMLTSVAQWVVRAAGAFMVVVGAIIWTGNDGLVPIHMTVGIVLVMALWVLALVAYRVRVAPGLVALAALWGFLLPVVGLVQDRLFAGDLHWIVELGHLVFGAIAIGLGETLVSAITKARRRAFYR